MIVAAVFMLGKIAANTIGSILAGRRFNDALQVGMTMPQMGEFSLAIGRLSPGDAAGFSPLGAVISIATAITSVLAPITSRSASKVALWVDRFTPAPLTWIVLSVQLGVDAFWSALSLRGESAKRFRHVRQTIFINAAIMGFLSVAGTGVVYIAPDAVSDMLSVPAGVAGMIIVGVVIGLSIPSAVVIWRSLGTIALLAADSSGDMESPSEDPNRSRTFRTMVEYGLATVLLSVLFLLALPLVIRLITLDTLSITFSLVLLISPALLVGLFSFRIQWVLEEAITDILGSEEENIEESPEADAEKNPDGDKEETS